jgi:translocation and assembly module TamA
VIAPRALALALLASALALPAPAQLLRALRAGPVVDVEWKAPEPLRELLAESLPPPAVQPGAERRSNVRPWMRDVRRRVPEIAGSEGYFSPTVEISTEGDGEGPRIVITVIPGPRTVVGSVEIEFRGDIALEGEERERRRRQLRDAWTLKPGAWFRSADWDTAKARLAEDLVETDYAAGELVESAAQVLVEGARANLKLVLDSGPPFTLGEIRIEGIGTYTETVVRRLVDVAPGERYDAERLTMLQRRLQAGPWFSSVAIDVERDRARNENVPVKITVTEQPRSDIGLALGYGTDDGFRAEVSYRYRDLFDRGFDLQSSMRVSQKEQFAYADVYLPPGLYRGSRWGTVPFRDSVGVLAEHSDSQNLRLNRIAVAGYRHFKLDTYETRVGLSYQIEHSYPEGAEEAITRALAPVIAGTWRHVDNIFDPRRGGVLSLQLAAGSKALASTADFLKVYGQYQYWIPLGADDQLLMRAEAGRNFTAGRESVPEDFLFRAGGARSNRGYEFESLGVQEGQAIVGGRVLGTASVEYVHWLKNSWGAAAFVDVGDAKDNVSDLHANTSYGVGVRLRTPAGPMALDVAYADGPRKFRLAFSVTVAF